MSSCLCMARHGSQYLDEYYLSQLNTKLSTQAWTKFVEKAEKIAVYSRREYVPCPAQGKCDTSRFPASGEFQVKNLCDVQVRTFPFSSYPKHVRNLHTYAWKPIIIDITLREFGAIFWGDSSIRLKGSLRKLLPISLNHHGYMTHFNAFDPKKKEEIKHQYFYTHPQLYDNLGVNRTEYYNSDGMAPHAAANRQLYVNSSYIQQAIVQPMLKCALEYHCISPVGARLPKHRFDASILAILIYKNLKGEWKRTNNDNRYFDEVVYLRKNNLGKEKVQTCLW
ncbi:uncharacterized protein LOC135154083 isoform X2 [Lytechinus pictus]|uniref:uncharacterized protein LOC135154083 isoform X2 n=1 Tax=Lytechinus pictus TaxID=7653 RepID=UPI0030B9E579